MQNFKRIFLIVLDSVGIGAMPDAKQYNDEGAHTLRHIAEEVGGLHLPNLASLGLGNIDFIPGVPEQEAPASYYTKMGEASVGKDTMTGHWELMGLHITQPFLTFPNGFPQILIEQLERITGRQIIGNKVASGTVIIEELGIEHLKTGALIVYTSADSVLQIAAHEDVVHIDELYEICKITRELTLAKPFRVGRIIARPFIGQPGHFERTANRHDYALKPFAPTVLDHLAKNNYDVIALGKITDIFSGAGITETIHTKNNDDGVKKLLQTMTREFTGLCFINLVDFDSVYGHRRDPLGYGKALETFDAQLATILQKLQTDDLLIITADHGNDPTHHGTDHTREYVPLLMFHQAIAQGTELKIRDTFADVGATIADNFAVNLPQHGKSMLRELMKG